MSTIHCHIMTPHGVYKEMDTEIINIETNEGQRGILPEHMPLVTMLKVGKMSTIENGQREEYAVSGGMFYFRENKAEILTDAIEGKSEIDLERAIAAKERAERRLAEKKPNLDVQRAEIALARALNRISVYGKQI